MYRCCCKYLDTIGCTTLISIVKPIVSWSVFSNHCVSDCEWVLWCLIYGLTLHAMLYPIILIKQIGGYVLPQMQQRKHKIVKFIYWRESNFKTIQMCYWELFEQYIYRRIFNMLCENHRAYISPFEYRWPTGWHIIIMPFAYSPSKIIKKMCWKRKVVDTLGGQRVPVVTNWL